MSAAIGLARSARVPRSSHFVYDDGGRAAAGYRGDAGDCAVRAIAIATRQPYVDVYAALFDGMRQLDGPRPLVPARIRMTARVDGTVTRRALRRQRRKANSPRSGVPKEVSRAYLRALGWTWTPCMAARDARCIFAPTICRRGASSYNAPRIWSPL